MLNGTAFLFCLKSTTEGKKESVLADYKKRKILEK